MDFSLAQWPLWPAVVLSTYFIGALPIYALRSSVRGAWRDENLEGRPTTAILGLWVRLYFAWVMRPIFAALRVLGLPADAITTLSTLLATGGAVALAAGHFTLGGWLMLFGGMCDFLDGRLARLRGEASKAGAALDSVLDRYSDAVVLGGLAWYYRDCWVLVPVLVLLASSMMVSYVRAKGEGFGLEIKGGVAQRAERVVVLGAALVFSLPVHQAWFGAEAKPMYWLTVGAVILLAVLSSGTALLRLARLHNGLGGTLFQSWGGAGKGSLLRHVVSAVVATGGDFLLVLALVSALDMSAWLATALGCVLGAVLNFTLNRVWTFGSKGRVDVQSGRYLLVSTSSALLNAGGVAVLMLLPADYRVAWLVARVLIFMAWNYPLQKTWVFAQESASSPKPAPSRGSARGASGYTSSALLVVLMASLGQLMAPQVEAKTFVPVLEEDGDFSESWTALSVLADGTYVYGQVAVSNIGPGDKKGVCRILVQAPGGEAFTRTQTFDEDQWSSANSTLSIGSCVAKRRGERLLLTFSLGDALVEWTMKAGGATVSLPQSKIKNTHGFYHTEILAPWSASKVTMRLPGQSKITQEGTGYLDHTRSTLLPSELASRWFRARAMRGDKSVLLLARYAPGSTKPKGWIWSQGQDPVPLSSLVLKGSPKRGWEVEFSSSQGQGSLTVGRPFLRHAPVEEHGWLGAVAGAVVGNPVTYSCRASLVLAKQPALDAIVEVSFADE